MHFATGPELGNARLLEKLRAKSGPLSTVLALHALLFYFIYSGLMTRMVDAAMPRSVMVSFVAEAPQAKSPPPAAPKTVPVAVLQPPVLPQVPIPVIQVAQPPNTVTVVQTAAPAEKAPAPAVLASAAPAPASTGPKTITTGVEYLQPPQPVYPAMSRRMGEQGRVVLRVLVSESGKPDQVLVQTSSGSLRLDEAGRQAALRALFKPHLQDGRAVAVYVIVPLNFQLAS